MEEKEDPKSEKIKMGKYNPFRCVLMGCIFFSILIHIGALLFLNKHFLCLYSPYTSLLKSHSNLSASLDVNEYKNQTEDSFLDFIFYVGKKTNKDQKDIAFEEKKSLFEKIPENKQNTDFIKIPLSIDKKTPEKFSYNFEEKNLKNELIQQEISIKNRKHLKKPETEKYIISSLKSFAKEKMEGWQQEENMTTNEKGHKEDIDAQINFYFKKADLNKKNELFSFLEVSETQRYLRKTYPNEKVSSLSEKKSFPYILPTLKDLNTLSLNEQFDIEVVYNPLGNNEGYAFAITLIPHLTKEFSKIPQNFYFLMDCSNNIQRNRLTKTRHAIISSLAFLKKNDRFNIYTFNTGMDVLFETTAFLSPKSVTRAKNFLLQAKLGSFFSNTNFYQPLFSLFNDSSINENQMHTVILLTSGEELNKPKNFKMLEKWSAINKGFFSFFVVGLDSDKNNSLLELFAKKNRGMMLTSSSKAGIKRQLHKIMKSISLPIAKEIVPTIYFSDKESKITLYPSEERLGNFYAKHPYVILGQTKNLDDFVLFLQGNGSSGWFHIKKKISFEGASKGGKELEKQIALQKAEQRYNAYLHDHNPAHLQQARKLLEPFGIQPLIK